MIRKYRICGIVVECEFRFPTMTARAEKYLSAEGEPELVIPFDEERIRQVSRDTGLSADDCEIVITAEEFYRSLPERGGFMLHSSAVALDGRAYLFSAPSGTGKSTHTSLWLEAFGERAVILNDDKPAIMIRGGAVTACGTPWSGKSDLNINAEFPLQGICILGRSAENHIEPLPADRAVYPLLDQTIRPADSAGMDALLTCIDEVASKVPIWQMGCNMSVEAAQTAYRSMSRHY